MIVEIGSGPYEEEVAQVGDSDYLEVSKLELTVFRDQIRRKYPKVKKLEDQGRIQLRIKSFYHDFGSYRELVISVDESDEEAVDLAFSVESDDKGVLGRWDRISQAELIRTPGTRMTEQQRRNKMPNNLHESSLSRIHQFIQEYDCAIISASRDEMVNCIAADVAGRAHGQKVSKSDNADASKKLKASLLSRGYGVTRVDGSYIEDYNTAAAKEVKETSYFVVNRNHEPNFAESIAELGEAFCQDSVIIIPEGGKNSFLLGTNNAAFPGYKNRIDLGAFKGGKESEFMTRVGGRAFVLESYEDLPRLQRMAVRAMDRNLWRKND